MNWLLVFVPITIWLEYFGPKNETLLFVTSCLAILPLAGWLGHATEHIAARAGQSIGGLLNATFGNAAELIIALAALRKGLFDVVKASLTGSIIGNVLLVAGLAILAGGFKYKIQRFGAVAARTNSTLLLLASFALVVPAAFHALAGPSGWPKERGLSLEIAVVLLVLYAASLLFTLHTHRQIFESAEDHGGPGIGKSWSMGKATAILGVATALIAWMSEILVGSVEHAAQTFGMTPVFVGVIVVAIVGNAAEHSTAVIVAMKNKMDLSLGIAVGSSIQIALFVAPVLVLASYFVGPRPMDLVFTPAEVMAVVLSVWILTAICDDGESHWLEGAMLLGVYVILAIAFYFLPESAVHAGNPPLASESPAH